MGCDQMQFIFQHSPPCSQDTSFLVGNINFSVHPYVYTPKQKYKITLKNEEKDIVYNS